LRIQNEKMRKMKNFVDNLPKAELHLHIEGTFEPELIFEIAGRNRIELEYPSVDALRAAYQFDNLQQFLDLYYVGASVLVEDQDFYDLTRAYLERVAAQGVAHCEIFFDPQTHTERGVAFATVINGISRALSEAEEDLGITSRLIMCFLRHLDEAAAIETLQSALPFRDKFIGVGLDSSELGNPPEKFARVFDLAGREGLKRVAHAGEEGPASYVRGAIETLHVDRVDHGNACLDDPSLVDDIIARDLALTVCPLSNLKLGGVARLEDHPLKRMIEAGLKVTINSDDPAYFGGYVTENYVETAAALDLSKNALADLARNSFIASFLPDDEKAGHLASIDNYMDRQ
jgi:adenosine deaminase